MTKKFSKLQIALAVVIAGVLVIVGGVLIANAIRNDPSQNPADGPRLTPQQQRDYLEMANPRRTNRTTQAPQTTMEVTNTSPEFTVIPEVEATLNIESADRAAAAATEINRYTILAYFREQLQTHNNFNVAIAHASQFALWGGVYIGTDIEILEEIGEIANEFGWIGGAYVGLDRVDHYLQNPRELQERINREFAERRNED